MGMDAIVRLSEFMAIAERLQASSRLLGLTPAALSPLGSINMIILSDWLKLNSALRNRIELGQSTVLLSDEILGKLSRAVDAALPHMTEEERKACKDLYAPTPETPRHNTRNTDKRDFLVQILIAILGILVSIYFGISEKEQNIYRDTIEETQLYVDLKDYYESQGNEEMAQRIADIIDELTLELIDSKNR